MPTSPRSWNRLIGRRVLVLRTANGVTPADPGAGPYAASTSVRPSPEIPAVELSQATIGTP